MKRIFTAIIIAISLLFACSLCASAHNVGDIINKTVYTDIVASINDYNIASYNIDGYTAVVAEDLRNYGFDVQWKPDERALYIKRAYTNKVTSTYIAPQVPSYQVGQKAFDVLATDIKTYINGNLVPSYNIGGLTIINFNDLAPFGNVSYTDSIRRLDLDIKDGLDYKIGLAPSTNIFDDYFFYFETNSADGVQVRWSAKNNTNKTIHYYTTKYYMLNPVGDFAFDRWGNNNFTIKTVGPVKPGESLLDITGKHEGEVYGAPVEYLYLYSIELEYSDGTEETIYYEQIGPEK